MAGQLNLSVLVKLHADLMSMRPGEDRDFRMPGRQPIRVHCMDGVYPKGDEKFYIHGVELKGEIHHLWRDVDATACGLYYIFAA